MAREKCLLLASAARFEILPAWIRVGLALFLRG
eukprot:COSAG06_NODE_10116_length_1747_cov_1.212985_2_plen_32_part_01